ASTLAVVNAYLLHSLPYPSAHRLHHVMYAPPGPAEPRGMTALDWQSLSDVVEDVIATSGETFYLTDAGYTQTARGVRVSPGFLRGLGVRAVIGRGFSDEEFHAGAEPVALIGHALWRDRFGSDPDIVGRQFRANAEQQGGSATAFRIVGVLAPGFWFGRDSHATVDLLVPLRSPVRTYMVGLREDVPAAAAERRITEAAKQVGSDFPPNWTGVHLESVHARYVAAIRPVLAGITIAAVLVVALVCANVAVLLVLRTMRRQKEMAVRIALGAERRHLVRMLAAETGLICAAALMAGLALTAATLRLLAPLIQTQLGRPAPSGASAIALDSTVLLIVGGLGAVITLALAFTPLLAPWQRRLADMLRREGMSGTDGPFMRRLRTGLIAFEVAGSLVLLIGCGLMLRSVVNLVRTDLGYDPEHLVRVRIVLPGRTYPDPATLQGFYSRLIEQLAPQLNVPMSLGSSFPPFYENHKQPLEADGIGTTGLSAGVLHVGAGHFGVLRIEVKHGRGFTNADRPGSEPVAVISETLARRLWPAGNALGQRIRTGERMIPDSPVGAWRTVVGVVRDVRQTYSDEDLKDVYLPFLQAPGRFASLQLRTDRSAAFWLASVRTTVAELDPFVLVADAQTLASENRQLAGAQFLAAMLAGFAAFTALLAVIGIYGTTAYAVQQREREVAIRMALGATGSAVVRLFLKDGVRVLGLGLALGLAGSFGAMRILANQIHGVDPLDGLTVGATCVLLSAAALLATWWPARRAATRDPMAVLKEG
ncbi:MAG: ABC transporter permease, partial [Verrucomicrobia bacterium]|nr:ABC transporter permease [Verrucomicrobiota bacterium]